jgi:hypothetical protein
MLIAISTTEDEMGHQPLSQWERGDRDIVKVGVRAIFKGTTGVLNGPARIARVR